MPHWNHFRAHERYRVQLGTTVHMRLRNLQTQGRVDNLSLGGASLTLAHPVRLGESLHLRFWATPPLELEGEVTWVAWADGGGVRAGVRFRHEQTQRLGELLALLGPAADPARGM